MCSARSASTSLKCTTAWIASDRQSRKACIRHWITSRLTMTFWPIAGVVLITTVAGAGAAFALANFLISWLEISSREGSSGYFAVFVTAVGLAGGFLVGLFTALIVQSGFLRAQGYALAIVAVLTIAAGI